MSNQAANNALLPPTSNRRSLGTQTIRIAIIIQIVVLTGIARAQNTPPQWLESYASYEQALTAGDEDTALTIGNEIFQELAQNHRASVDFNTYRSKLMAAQYLARQMVDYLKAATEQQIRTMAGRLFSEFEQTTEPIMLPPAKQFYETSRQMFERPIHISSFTTTERAFLASYYHLKLKNYISLIAQAGQALAIAEPQFENTHHYALVLPLLHTREEEPVDTSVLPSWMQTPEQLQVLADICLLHFDMPLQAMILARRVAEINGTDFVAFDYYCDMAQRCGTPKANTAVACLERAIAELDNADPNTTQSLLFEIAQLWWDSGNYALAAGQAREIFTSFPQGSDYGQAVQLYYYALSRNNNVEAILADIDTAIHDERCVAQRPKLMYIKWWALRRQRRQDVRIAALEHDILRDYSDHEMVAPIILTRATDMLARQDYAGAQQCLTELVDRFPESRAAQQANRILERLQTISSQ